jgi:hypothetical protein
MHSRENWYAGAADQDDLDAVMFSPISSTILKWLRLKSVCWKRDVKPCTASGLGLFGCWVIIF